MRCYCKITTHLIQRPPCYQRGSPHQDPAGNWTTRRPPDHRTETQIAMVLSCLPFIRSGQNHLARHCERGKKTRQTEKKVVVRQHQGMDKPEVRQVPEGSGEQGKMEWLQNHLLCSNDPRGKGIDEMMMRDVSILLQFASLYDSRECNISCGCMSDYKLSFTRCSQTGHRDKYTQLSLLLLRHWWHRHRMISKLMMHVLTLNPQRRNAV